MSKWIFTVKEGTNLRKEINNGHEGNILRSIKACYQEAIRKSNDDDMIDELEQALELIGDEDELADNEDYETLEDFGFDSFEELVDERLYELYNLADSWMFFIAL